MRIIAGEYKARRIEMPRGADIRPTSDKVREALFNMISKRVEGASVLDLFAGSGSLGIEALSRGAASAVFIDKDKRCVDCIKGNVSGLGIDRARCEIYRNDAFRALEKLGQTKRRFDLVFLDPPYHEGALRKSLIYLCNYDILNTQNLVVAEHFKKDDMPDDLECLTACRKARYGDTALTFYTRKAP
jgi:16S rRNA (guanine(966)-N(2))-methyltransferase RsmD